MIKNISLIVPFLNEEDNIDRLCEALDSYARGKNYDLELVFVDDGSTDGSVEKIKKFPFKNVKGKLIKLSKNYGSHAAIRAGLQGATAENCLFCFSADSQEPLEMIDLLADKLGEGYDYVCARKKSSKVGWIDRSFSYLYSWLIRSFAVKDFPFGGVNAILINKKVKENLNKHVERNSSIFLQTISLGYKMAVLDVEYKERGSGKSKWTLGKRIKLMIDTFVSYSFFPIRLVSIVGIILFVCGIILALSIIIIKLFNIVPLALGWPTLISIIAMGFGITNISLGIIAEYLWRTFDYTRDSAPFIVDETTDLREEK